MKHSLGQLLAIVGATIVFAMPNRALAEPQKDQLHGILNMGDINIYGASLPVNSIASIESVPPGSVDGTVINVKWQQLQPAPNTLDTSAIEKALDEVRGYNQRHPKTPLAVKLRVWPGVDAPEWVKSIGGAPIPIPLSVGGRGSNMSLTVGRYWSREYAQSWRNLQKQLAQKFDQEPLIREVTAASGSSLEVASTVVDHDPQAIKSFLNAGYSDAAFLSCLMNTAADYAAWRTTSIELGIGPYAKLDSGRAVADFETSLDIMRKFRQKLGSRGILANYALAFPESPNQLKMIDFMQRVGPPIEFETASPRAGWLPGGQLDWDATIKYGASLGANAIELWGGKFGFTTVAPEKLHVWSDMIKRGFAQ